MGLWQRVKGVFGARDDGAAQFLRLARRVCARVPGVKVVDEDVGEMMLTLETANGRQQFYAGNMYVETRDWPLDARTAHVEAFLREILAPRPDVRSWSDVRERLLPVLRGLRPSSPARAACPRLAAPSSRSCWRRW